MPEIKANPPRIGIAGLTHLGVNTAAAIAAHGFPTLWFDPDAQAVERLEQGELPVSEPGLAELFAANRVRIAFSADAQSLKSCRVVYIAADVPTDDRGQSDLTGIRALIDQVSAALDPAATLVVLCQVPPGFTRTLSFAPERLVYQVETLIFGQAVERAMKPERYIVGLHRADAPLPADYETLLRAFGCPILPMGYEGAELCKIAINCFLVASVSTTNTLAEICERIGADWSQIAPALRLDKRIGPHAYLSPGLGIAGGNLERDLATVCRYAEQYGTDDGVVRAWIHNSGYRKDWALRILHQRVLHLESSPRLAVWGLAYKKDTHSVKNSPSLALLAHLHDFHVTAHDPVVKAQSAWHPRLVQETDALAACREAHALVIMTPWDVYKAMPPSEIAQRLAGKIVIDPYAMLEGEACRAAGLLRYTLGVAGE